MYLWSQMHISLERPMFRPCQDDIQLFDRQPTMKFSGYTEVQPLNTQSEVSFQESSELASYIVYQWSKLSQEKGLQVIYLYFEEFCSHYQCIFRPAT